MKKLMVMCLLVLQAFMLNAFAENCGNNSFTTLKFCGQIEDEDDGLVNGMVILNGDNCPFEHWQNSVLMGSGTWEREDPDKLAVILFHYLDDEGKTVLTARAKYQKSGSVRKLVVNGLEFTNNCDE